MMQLLDYFREFFLKLCDLELKITRILTCLVALIGRNFTVINIKALECIIDLLDSIESLPPEYSQVGICYLLPSLISTADKNPNWQYYFTAKMPSILASFSRLWPDLLGKMPQQPVFFRSLLDNRTGGETRRTILVSSFLQETLKISETKPYSVFSSICFIIFQLLNTITNVPMVVDFFTSVMTKLHHADLVRFLSDFHDSLQRALVNLVIHRESLEILLPAFQILITRKHVNLCYFSLLASVSAPFINSTQPILSYCSRSLLRAMHPHYQRMAASVAMQRRRCPTQLRSNREHPSLLLPSLAPHERPPSTATRIQTCLGPSFKLHGPVSGVACVTSQSTIIWHCSTMLSEFRVDGKAHPRVRHVKSCHIPNPILSIDRYRERMVICHKRQVDFRRSGTLDVDHSFRSPGTPRIAKLLPDKDAMAFVFERTPSSFYIRGLMDQREIVHCEIGDRRILQLCAWQASSLLGIVANDNVFIVYDTRVELPIATHPVQSDEILECLALSGRNCVFHTRNGFAFYDVLSAWRPYFTVAGNARIAMAREDELILCDQRGTFSCKADEGIVSLFDGSHGEALTAVNGRVKLPIEERLSLHGHTFTLTAADCTSSFCVTGDEAGFVHFWSPWKAKLTMK
jgi:hypothetical protein